VHLTKYKTARVHTEQHKYVPRSFDLFVAVHPDGSTWSVPWARVCHRKTLTVLSDMERV
jgi:hypothetical protein